MNKLNYVWRFIRSNKYLCIFVCFIALIGFLDDNSFMHRLEMQRTISNLQQEIRVLRDYNEKDSMALHRLRTDKKEVELVARTRYLMKRDNEDVFVFVDTTSQPMNTIASAVRVAK